MPSAAPTIGAPAGPTATRLGAYLCLPRETLSRPGIAETVEQEIASFMAVNDEDMAISAAVQRGQRSRFARPGPLRPLEQPIWQFIRYFAARLEEG